MSTQVLAQEKVSLSRTAEATRLMQLQLVTSMTQPSPSAPTGPGAAAASPERQAAGAAAADKAADNSKAAEGGGGEATSTSPRPPTPERACSSARWCVRAPQKRMAGAHVCVRTPRVTHASAVGRRDCRVSTALCVGSR